ncbi:hypothetical protein Mahau_0088 [Mahella australiensis 50-1 BON]|uniref:Uncharacterized protein n=1 Tax=Mahella australiensis (strain DSM 15567 / CIP 107919 / 50-1 BON) TaxID=697281 RepID=F3ZVG1_MAHA5|nr:hypothetical protein Mahau_0088 [Mahella australiensis 50-1 BON]
MSNKKQKCLLDRATSAVLWFTVAYMIAQIIRALVG